MVRIHSPRHHSSSVGLVGEPLLARLRPSPLTEGAASAIAARALWGVACAASPLRVQDAALTRAVFDLECPKGQLVATQLGDTNVIGRTATSPGLDRTVVGVVGCARRAVYVVECVPGPTCPARLDADTAAAR